MNCPDCGDDCFDGIACLCGYGPPVQPFEEPSEGLPAKVLHDLAHMELITEDPWKEPCPQCKRRTFNGRQCNNLLCRYTVRNTASPQIGPGADIDQHPLPPISPGVPSSASIGAAAWKDICPVCTE